MYEEFYGFKHKPFRIVPDPGCLYLSSKHERALTYLEYGLMEDVGFILLTGEVGMGKTTLIRHILDRLASGILTAVIFNTKLSGEELLGLMLRSFDLTPEKDGKTAVLDTLYHFLIDRYAEGKRVLLVIDEAQNLPRETLEEVRMLSNLQSDEHMLLQIMLAGQPELRARLRRPELSSFAQRIAVQYHLSPLTSDELKAYIGYRLEQAGGKPDLFEPGAMDLICRISRGVPRTVNLLCDAALVYGFGYELKTIDISVMDQVIKDKGGIGLEEDRPDPASAATTVGPGALALTDRLETLENAVDRLRMELDLRVEELDRRGETFKDDLVEKLQAQLKWERRRSDRLLVRHTHLFTKHKELEKRLDRMMRKTKSHEL